MTHRRSTLQGISAAAFMAAGASLFATTASAADPIEVEVSGEASATAGLVDREAETTAEGDVNARVTVKGSTILDNGLELGAVLKGRLDGDQPVQMFSAGRYSSLQIGGPRGIAPATSDAYLQGAYAYARGAFGQVIIGRDQGIAQTLAVTAPTIFQSINVSNWQSDLSGLNDVHTLNDFTGYSSKISYTPPPNFLGGAIGGLQLGVSYSPELRDCGDRLCASEDGLIVAPSGELLNATSNWEDAIETALYYQAPIKLGDDRLFIGIGASYVGADEASGIALPIYQDYRAYSVGLNLAYRGVTIGGSVKTTNAGLNLPDEDGYLAFDAGVTFRTGEEEGDWGFMLGYGQSEANAYGPNPLDPTVFRDTQTAQAGVTYMIGRGITIGAAAQYVESVKPESVGGPEEATTVVIESSIKF